MGRGGGEWRVREDKAEESFWELELQLGAGGRREEGGGMCGLGGEVRVWRGKKEEKWRLGGRALPFKW
jgi:hypothetical protein